MTERVQIVLTSRNRQEARRLVSQCLNGSVMQISPPLQSRRDQNEYHAVIGEIAKQVPWRGKRLDPESWKRLLVDAFARALADMGTPLSDPAVMGVSVESLDGRGVVHLGYQTRYFTEGEAREFSAYLRYFLANRLADINEVP